MGVLAEKASGISESRNNEKALKQRGSKHGTAGVSQQLLTPGVLSLCRVSGVWKDEDSLVATQRACSLQDSHKTQGGPLRE